VGTGTSGGIRDIWIYNNTVGLCDAGHEDETKSCGWGPALHLKTTILRSNRIENVVFRDNIVYNTSMFILVETDYQVNHQDVPLHYNKTMVRNIVFQNNQALGEAIGANFNCSKQDPCHEIRVVNKTIAKAAAMDPNNTIINPWSCHYIDSYQVEGNTPGGLEECMAASMNPSLAVWNRTNSSIHPMTTIAMHT
jgi:polygalacturonase